MSPRSSTTSVESGKPAVGAKAGKTAATKTSNASFDKTSNASFDKTSNASFDKTSATRSAEPRATRPAATTPRPKTKKTGRATPEERLRLIAEAAYFKAEQRDFARGGELGDWIEAEAEIDTLLDSRGIG